MAKEQLNARVSDLTRRQLNELGERWGTTQTETLSLIIDRVYNQDNAMTQQQVVGIHEAKGPYPGVIDGQAVYGWQGRYWVGHVTVSSDGRRLRLTPVTETQREYLDKNYAYIINGKS